MLYLYLIGKEFYMLVECRLMINGVMGKEGRGG